MATIHGGGIHHRVFVARFRAILKSRIFLCEKHVRISDCLLHDKLSGCFIWRQYPYVDYRDATLRTPPCTLAASGRLLSALSAASGQLMVSVSEPIVETLVFSINPVLQCMTPLRIAFATQAAVERPQSLQYDDYSDQSGRKVLCMSTKSFRTFSAGDSSSQSS